MNLNSVDWSHAQSLLIKLVQVLSPLTVHEIPASVFLNRRFVIPSFYSHENFFPKRRPVKLLSTLHAVQKEVEEWVSDPKVENGVKERATKVANGNQVESTPSKEPATRTFSSVQEEKQSIVKQAKELIHQVQEAIGRLSHSSYIQDPREAPFMKTLKELKPKLDRIIESVSEDQSMGERAPVSFRHALRISSREEIVKNLHEGLDKMKPLPVSSFRIEAEEQPQLEVPSKKVAKKQELEEEGTSILTTTSKKKEDSTIPIVTLAEKTEEKGVISKVEPRPVSLASAPIFEPKRIVLNRKKKNRKGFWFKEDENKNHSQ